MQPKAAESELTRTGAGLTKWPLGVRVPGPRCCGKVMERQLAEIEDGLGRVFFVVMCSCPNCRRFMPLRPSTGPVPEVSPVVAGVGR